MAEIEEKEQNKDRGDAIRNLNREINGYLKFDTEDLTMNMNNAFEGKKAASKDMKSLYVSETAQDKRVKAILAEVGGQSGKLESILEESMGAD